MESSPAWNLPQLLQSPLFVSLRECLAQLAADRFPGMDDLNALLSRRTPPICVDSGRPLRFVVQGHGKLPFAAQYEPRCYLAGELQTRADNWHDLFNALVWLTFPAAKAAINARHYQSLLQEVATVGKRGGGRDMLTLFDESGVVVACADDELAGLWREFRWQELFWRQRKRVQAAMDFHLFGHGLYQKALQPYLGFTGQGLLLAVDAAYFSWPLARRLAYLDSRLADYLSAPQHCRATNELMPLPLLGIPGWAAENNEPTYYDNIGYFRPRPAGRDDSRSASVSRAR